MRQRPLSLERQACVSYSFGAFCLLNARYIELCRSTTFRTHYTIGHRRTIAYRNTIGYRRTIAYRKPSQMDHTMNLED